MDSSNNSTNTIANILVRADCDFIKAQQIRTNVDVLTDGRHRSQSGKLEMAKTIVELKQLKVQSRMLKSRLVLERRKLAIEQSRATPSPNL
jgi:hypothetical protein